MWEVVDPGLKTGVVGPKSSKDGGTWHLIEGIIPEIFMELHTNYSIYENSSESVLISYSCTL